MEVKIGVTNVNRELSVDTDLDAKAVEEQLRSALADGGVFVLADARGRRVLVPIEKVAYVDITTSVVGQVGFRS